MNPVRQELDLNFDFINRKAPLMTSPQGISIILREKCSAVAQIQRRAKGSSGDRS